MTRKNALDRRSLSLALGNTKRWWLTPTAAALVGLLGACAARQSVPPPPRTAAFEQTVASPVAKSERTEVQTAAGALKIEGNTNSTVAASSKPYSSERMDGVAPVPAPRLEPETRLPSPATYDPDQMPAYNSAKPPANAEPLSLEQVYLMALENDPVLRGAYSEMQAIGYGTTAARAGLLPNINIEGNYGRVNQNVVDSENAVYQQGRARWGENGYALTLTQPLFDLAAYQKWRQAQESERKEVASFAYAQQDLMLRTATAYLSILAAQDQIDLTAAERETTQKQMELVRVRYQSGQVTQVNVSEVQARLDVQEANYLLVSNEHADKQQALQEIIGYGDLALVPVRKNLTLNLPEPNNPDAWLQKSLEQNWSIRAAAASVAVAEKEVSVQQAGYYPNVNVKASSGRNDTGGSLFGGGSTIDDTRVSLNVNIPIFQGGYTYGMSHAAASRLNSAQTQLSLTRRKVQRQVFSSFRNIAVGIDRIKALQSSVTSFELALKLKQEGFSAGLNDNVSVLDATRNLYNAKRQEAEARYNFVLDTLKLKQAAGILSSADIVAISNSVL